MKKIFFFAFASLALASCSQDEEFAPEKSTNGSDRANGALSFSTYTAGGTRATDVTSTQVKAGFTVAAWYDGGLYFNAGETAKVTAADGIADTQQDTYYWPSFSAGAIGFRAFNNEVGAAWTADKEYESIDFTVASTAATQKDLVIAYAEASSKPDKGVQPLNFTHALSKVNFSFKGATADKYTINKVEVIAAGGAATMAFAETTELGSTNGTNDTDQPNVNSQAEKVIWTYTAIDGTQPLVKKAAAAAANQGVLYTYYDVTAGAEASAITDQNFMLLPQTGKIAVRVYYKVEDANGKLIGNCGYELTDSKGRHESNSNYDNTDGKAIYGCKTVVINLGGQDDDTKPDAVAIPAWEAGKAYRFTMTLPKDNFIGDKSGDGVADGLDDLDDDDATNDVDLDGDNDTDPSEFDILTPIRFSVTVSNWVDVTANNITIK